jgi:hypothetical protein
VYPVDFLLGLLELVFEIVLAAPQSGAAELLTTLDAARFSLVCFLDLSLQKQIRDKLVSELISSFVMYNSFLLQLHVVL